MRIVHLIEPRLCGKDRGIGACPLRMVAELARRQPQTQHQVIILGHQPEIRIAKRCGVETIGLVSVPRLRPMSAKSALAAMLRPMEFSGDPFTAVHAWSPRAAALAALAVPHGRRFATILVGPDGSRGARVFSGVMNRVPTTLLVACEQFRDAWSDGGVPSTSMHVCPPGVVCEWMAPSSRCAVRQMWNDGDDLGDGAFVVGIITDQPAAVDARLAFEIVGRLALGGRDVRMIIHPRSGNRADAERAARRIGLDHLLIQDWAIAEPWRVLPGLDAVLALADASRLSTFWACAAGLPCVIEQSSWIERLAQDSSDQAGNEAVLHEFPRGSVNAATALLSRWCDDAVERRVVGETSARFVHRHFDFQAFVDRFDHACDMAMNERGVRRTTVASAIR